MQADKSMTQKPGYETILQYALTAVRSEANEPYHDCYDQIAAMNDVLNHFAALTDADEDLIREVVSDAEDQILCVVCRERVAKDPRHDQCDTCWAL